MKANGLMQRPILVALMVASLVHAALIFGFRYEPPRVGQGGRSRIAMTLVRPAPPQVETPPAEPVMPPGETVAGKDAAPPTPAPPEPPKPVTSEPPPVKAVSPPAAEAPSPPPMMGPPRPGPKEAFIGPIQPARIPMVGPPAPSARELEARRQRLAAEDSRPVVSPPPERPEPDSPATSAAPAGKPGPRPATAAPPAPRPVAPVAPSRPVAGDDEEEEEPGMASAEEEEDSAPAPVQPPRPAPKSPVSASAPVSRGVPPAPAISSQPEGSPNALLLPPRQTPTRPTRPAPVEPSRPAPRQETAVTPPVPRKTAPGSSPPDSSASMSRASPRTAPPATSTGRSPTQPFRRGREPAGRPSAGPGGRPVRPGLSAGLLSQQISEVSENIYMNRSLAMLGTKIVYAKEVKNHRPVVAAYEQGWQDKVEQHGNRNFPEEARRQKLSGSLVLAVGIQPDGRVYSVQVLQSSGYAVLDNAARQIVDLAAPFAPLPNEIRQEVDVLVITRTWRFDSNFRLETRAR